MNCVTGHAFLLLRPVVCTFGALFFLYDYSIEVDCE